MTKPPKMPQKVS